MRVEEAPQAGWYPDPEGGSRLRWWEGADWSDRYRAPPTPGVVELRNEWQSEHPDASSRTAQAQEPVRGMSRRDSDAIINEVRAVAREEVNRAADAFEHKARSLATEFTPLITEYTNKFIRWVRFFAVIGIVIAVGWLAFQIFAQVTLFDWFGDRIDNITNDGASPLNQNVGYALTASLS